MGAWNRGYWFASATNVVFMDYRIRDVVFLISLTHKLFFFGGFALTFSGNTYLNKICVLDFQSLINRLCVTFHIAIFSPYCCLYCLYEQSSAHTSFSLRFAVTCIMDKLKHKEIISPVLCGANRSFKRQLKKNLNIFDDRSLNQGF